jgi:hypothetical protein
VKILGWDKDPGAVEIARENARAAGIGDLIEFSVHDIRTTTAQDVPSGGGCIVTDPPYGVRMDEESVETLYIAMGRQFNSSLPRVEDRDPLRGSAAAFLCRHDAEQDQYAVQRGNLLPESPTTMCSPKRNGRRMIAKRSNGWKIGCPNRCRLERKMAANRLRKNLAALKPKMAEQQVFQLSDL